METLEQQIANLKAEYNFKAEIETLFGNYKTLAFKSSSKQYDNCVSFDLLNTPISDIKAHVKYITDTLRCKEVTTLIGSAGGKNWTNQSGYTLRFDNSINHNHADIMYISGRISVNIKVPVNFYQGITLVQFTRSVTDSEYHYFGGTSMNEIRNMCIRAYKLNCFKEIVWYGSDVTIYTDNIELKEPYENIVLGGTQD